MYHNFIGIDISKNDFVIAVHRNKKHLNISITLKASMSY